MPPWSSHMIQILNICNSCCGYYYYFPLCAVKDGLSTSLLFLSASLSTHGWLHASKWRVVVLLVVGGEDRNRGALLERAVFQWAGKHVGFSLNSFSVNRRLRTIFISGAQQEDLWEFAQEAGCKLVIFVQIRQILEFDVHSSNAFEILIFVFVVTFSLDWCLYCISGLFFVRCSFWSFSLLAWFHWLLFAGVVHIARLD